MSLEERENSNNTDSKEGGNLSFLATELEELILESNQTVEGATRAVLSPVRSTDSIELTNKSNETDSEYLSESE